jgi:site-specific DNA-methyltransferase (adenine-specific)
MLKITNEDNMALMARYPDKHFDLAIVDPPYGISRDKQQNSNDGKWGFKKYHESNWDNNAPDIKYFNELKRISKNQIIWGANHFISKIPFDSSCWIVWEKQNGDSSFADCELAWTSFKSSVRMFSKSILGYARQRIHPTQKPVELYKWLLDKYAKPGDKILDTHLGSGSIAIACHDYGFNLTACELDTEYFNKAMDRINNYTKQQKLF